MAKRSRRGGNPVRIVERSISDAQKVLARYISSGSDQITDTMNAVRRIFDNRQLAAALKKARAARLAVTDTVSGRKSAKKRKTKASARRKAAARSGVKRKTGPKRKAKRRARR